MFFLQYFVCAGLHDTDITTAFVYLPFIREKFKRMIKDFYSIGRALTQSGDQTLPVSTDRRGLAQMFLAGPNDQQKDGESGQAANTKLCGQKGHRVNVVVEARRRSRIRVARKVSLSIRFGLP